MVNSLSENHHKSTKMTSRRNTLRAQNDKNLRSFKAFATSFPISKWHRHECLIWHEFGNHSEAITRRKQFTNILKSIQQCGVDLDDGRVNKEMDHGITMIKYGRAMLCTSAFLNNTSESEVFHPKYFSKVSIVFNFVIMFSQILYHSKIIYSNNSGCPGGKAGGSDSFGMCSDRQEYVGEVVSA